jgi:hypothetical protein
MISGLNAQDDNLIEKEIKKVLSAQQNAWNEGNIEVFMQGYWPSDSLTFIGSKGLTYGWKKTLDNYKKSYPDKATMGKLQFDILKLDILSADAAILIGRYTLIREKDQPTGLFTLVWKKIDGKWVIVSDQTCG